MGSKPFSRGSDTDLSEGPIKKRHCTDVLFMILFFAHLGVYLAVAGLSYAKGDPMRLFSGEDFEGKLCGYEGQVSDQGYALNKANLLYFSLNITTVTETVVGGMFSSKNTTEFDPNAVYSAASTLLDPWNLFSTYGNGLVSELTNNFISVCSTTCDYNFTTAYTNRTFVWNGPSDPTMKDKWAEYIAAAESNPAMMDPFTFTALPESVCPYPAEYCIPLEHAEFAPILDMYCVPKITANFTSIVPSSFGTSISVGFGDMLGDIVTSWPAIILMAFVSLGIALAFLYMLRLCVGVFVWLSIALCFLLLIAGAVTILLYSQKCVGESLWVSATAISTDAASALFLGDKACPLGYSIQDSSGRDTFLVIAYVMFGIAAFYLIMVLIMFKRIRLGIAINKVAAQFVAHNMSTLWIPIVQSFSIFFWWALWIATIVFTVTMIPPAYRDMLSSWTDDYPGAVAGCSGASGVYIRGYTADTNKPIFACTTAKYVLNWQFWFSIAALFWVNGFVVACGQSCVAGAVGVWYFTPNAEKKSLGRVPVNSGVRNTFKYHMGTLAFGSLLLAVVQFIRAVFFWVEEVGKSQPKNAVLKGILYILKFIFWIIEKILKFINKNAFIQTALLGTHFCKSCSRAVGLIARNALRLGALGVIGGGVHFLGITFITVGTTVIGWATVGALYDGQLKSPIAPVLIILLMGYFVGSIVISVFSVAVDSILQCFLADEELHKTEGGAKYTPSQLVTFLKSNRPKDMKQDGSVKPGGQSVQVVGV